MLTSSQRTNLAIAIRESELRINGKAVMEVDHEDRLVPGASRRDDPFVTVVIRRFDGSRYAVRVDVEDIDFNPCAAVRMSVAR